MNKVTLLGLGLALSLTACSKDDADSGAGADGTAADGADGTGADGTGADGTDGTDGTTPADTFTINGVASLMFDLSTPAAEGLCVDILDPTNVLTGGDPEVVSSTTVGADGAWTATEVPFVSLGLLALVRDCADEGATFPSATGIPSDAYSELEPDSTLEGASALVIGADVGNGMQASLEAAGYTGDIATGGIVTGFILDASGGGITGATMGCGSCSPYYGDGDATDGLFSTGGAANTATDAAAGGLFVVPDATLTTYGAEAEGYTFGSSPLAALPGSAVIAVFYAD